MSFLHDLLLFRFILRQDRNQICGDGSFEFKILGKFLEIVQPHCLGLAQRLLFMSGHCLYPLPLRRRKMFERL
jgi:hypothetical protein